MVASSHWTSTEAAFRAFAPIQPAALTLKTTSAKGGDGKEAKGKGREKRDIKTSQGHWIAKYTDGPKELELWDLATTYEMTKAARELLPKTKLGLSVLQGENYKKAKQTLQMENYSYVELNWKYTFRSVDPKKAREDIARIEKDLADFLAVFDDKPKLIKMPRESIPFLKTDGFSSCLAKLCSVKAGLLVANSRRIRVPPSRVGSGTLKELTEGVVVGDYLFLETFDTIRQIASSDLYRKSKFGLVATGGIMDIAGVLDVFAAGADAVQLCTIFDVRGVQVLELLREQLAKLVQGRANLNELLSDIRQTDAKWFSVVTQAKQIEVQDVDTITQTVSSDAVLRPILKEALSAELPVVTTSTAKKTKRKGTVNPQFSLILNHANIGAFLLGNRCLEVHKMRRIELHGLNEFSARLKEKSFTYDFMILPKSAVDSFAGHLPKELKAKSPIAIGEIGQSNWEIVGDKRHTGSLSRVYHFGGNSARHALEEFLATSKPDTEQIAPEKLLPSLRFWHPEFGILAKPPLSRMYGLLAEDSVSKNWGRHWSWSEPLVFAASQGHIDQHGKDAAKLLHGCMIDVVKEIQTDLDGAVTELFSNGFVSHCLRLVLPQRRTA
jgi:dihydroorotate dehydrogenase